MLEQWIGEKYIGRKIASNLEISFLAKNTISSQLYVFGNFQVWVGVGGKLWKRKRKNELVSCDKRVTRA